MPAVEVAAPDDWARVREVRLAALADTPDAFWATLDEERAQPETFWRDRLERPDGVTFLATLPDDHRGRRDVGITTLLLPPDGDGTALLVSVWVAPTARGRGVGEALVRAAVEVARERGRRRVMLDVGDHNTPAIRLYERLGFRPTGRTNAFPPPRSHVTEHERALELDG